MSDVRETALNSNAWPFQEARKLVDRFEKAGVKPEAVIFETGYGPSGLPHIGTFGEVARTTMVRHAFETMSDIPTRLIAFSDDMDGLRKVPDNVPNKEMLASHLGKPLTSVPDPFSNEHPSFGAANNATAISTFSSSGVIVSGTDAVLSPQRTYGPNLPGRNTISSPVVGCMPTGNAFNAAASMLAMLCSTSGLRPGNSLPLP